MFVKTLEVRIAGDTRFTTNCYLVSKNQNDDCLLIIDPGDEAEAIIQAIADKQVAAIVITHGHYDHIGAVSELVNQTGAAVYAHSLDAQNIEKNYQEIKAGFVGFTQKRDSKSGQAASNLDNPQPLVTAQLKDGDLIDACGLDLEVLHTPGHTPGGICLYSADSALLFSGDTLFLGTCGRTDFDGGSPQSMHQSLSRLAKLPKATVVYPGHGASTTIGNEIDRGLSEY